MASKRRTRKVKVQPEHPPTYFEIAAAVPHAPNEVLKHHHAKPTSLSVAKPTLAIPKLAPRKNPTSTSGATLEVKIWNTLEWLATSALIFTVIFFATNFNAYSTLFLDKLNQLRGNVQTNPFVQNLTHPASTTQQPLPIATTANQSKKQIPYLAIQITPPDDRIVIPRINKNVPIVKVNSENLIKRDWAALETDIQEALRYGVVHYPGSAEPGEDGNVVITGHSSYFSWDPGRFKDVFALLHQVVIGDTVVVFHNQRQYLYKVYDKQVVTPDQIDVLTQKGENRLTLITCTPVGTNLKRLVIFAHPLAS